MSARKVKRPSPEDRIAALESTIGELMDAVEAPAKTAKRLGAVALEYYDGPDGKVFVRVPDERGRFVLTDRCVVNVACPACDSIAGEPCKNHYMAARGVTRYWAGTHCDRHTANKLRNRA